MRALARGWAVPLLVLVLVRPAWAEPDRPFRLQYSAPAECPGGEAVVASMQKSSRRVRLAAPGEAAFEIGVSVSSSGSGFVAVLGTRSPEGAETVRSVPAPTCAEAIDGAALIAAITMDPESFASARGPSEPEATPEDAPAATPAPAPPVVRAPAEAPPPAADMEQFARLDKRRSSGRLLAHASVGSMVWAISPSASPDFGAGVGYDFALDRAFSPRFDLSFQFGKSFPKETGAGDATFERLGGRLGICPFRWRAAAWLALRPCALVEVGRFRASGANAADPREEDLLWAALGATGEAEAILSPRWALGTQIGPVFPLTRGDFTFLPNHVKAFEIPPVGLYFQARIVVTIL